jgi:hypothetical protein
MRKAHQVLAGILAIFVVIQAMAIAYALAGLGKWIDDGHSVDKAYVEAVQDGEKGFQGSGGFAVHAIDGYMIIPALAIILLIVSLLANKKLPGAAVRGAILFGMVALQYVLGVALHDVVLLAPLHALNGFGIFAMAILAARKAAEAAPAPATVTV